METPEQILAIAREVIKEGHPPETRIARMASYLKDMLEDIGFGTDSRCKGFPPCRDATGCPCQQVE